MPMEDTFFENDLRIGTRTWDFATARSDYGRISGTLESSIGHQFHGRNDSGLEHQVPRSVKQNAQTELEAISEKL